MGQLPDPCCRAATALNSPCSPSLALAPAHHVDRRVHVRCLIHGALSPSADGGQGGGVGDHQAVVPQELDAAETKGAARGAVGKHAGVRGREEVRGEFPNKATPSKGFSCASSLPYSPEHNQ